MKKLLKKIRNLFRKKPVTGILQKLPRSWDEVTLKQFYQLQQVEFNSEDSANGMDTTIEFASIFTGVPVDELEALPIGDIIAIGHHLEFMIDKPKESKKTSLKWKTIKDITYDDYVGFLGYYKDIMNNYHQFIRDFSSIKLTDEEILSLPITDVMNGFFLYRKNLMKYMEGLEWRIRIKVTWLILKRMVQRLFKRTKAEESN